ncbi:MAG: OadG family protein [Huintestinicola sp.]|uniref:OadG family protein n=1 Tax=Huintestinicola sp. TaxID=2981661 RepID=UPI003EFFB4BB
MEMQMDWSYVGAVVISGLVIVFVALILLIAAVWIMGKLFTALKSGKSDKGGKTVETAPAPQLKKEPAPISQDAEDDSEIIAVIAAAVAAMSEEMGQPLRIRSIKRAGGVGTGNSWARAARSENTRAF